MRLGHVVLSCMLIPCVLVLAILMSPTGVMKAQTPCPAGQECEPNNRFGDATAINTPGDVRGRITPAGDADWYRFSLGSPGVLSLTIGQVAPDLGLCTRVWNSNRDALSEWFCSPAKGADASGLFDVPAGGQYYLEVASDDGSASSDRPYQLDVRFTPADDPFEPNDSFGQAARLQSGRPNSAYLFPVRDTDWYRLTVMHRGELQVSVTDVPRDLDIVFRVWDGNRDLLYDWVAPLARGGDTTGMFDLATAGDYYLEVTDGSYDARATAPYSQQFSFTPTADADEPNDLFRDGVELSIGQPHVATILPKGDTDWYRLQIDHQGELRVAVTDVPAEMDVAYRIWNANREVISDWFGPLAKGGDTEGTLDLPSPGRYFVEMADGSYDARSIQPFSVTAVFTPTADPFEPNDSFGAATPVQLDSPVQSNILPRGDVDWHYVDVPHQGQLSVTITDVPPALAVVLRVWNANRDVISDWFAPLARGGDTSAVVDVPTAGRYFIEVADSEYRERSVTAFTLTTTFVATADQSEPNDSLETAMPVDLEQAVAANILPVGDRDWYALDVARPTTLYVLVTRVSPELDISCRLWDSQPAVVRDWFGPLAKGGDTEASIEIAQAGRYFLEVADGYDDTRSIQPYLLYLSNAPIDPATVSASLAATPTVTATHRSQ